MKQLNPEQQTYVKSLIKQYEAMSQKGTVSFYEETVFNDMIDILEKEGKWKKAILIADAAIAQHPFSSDLYLRKAELLLNHNMIDECLVTIDRAELFAPSTYKLQLLRAESLALKGCFDEALIILNGLKGRTTLEELSDIFLIEANIYEDLRDYGAMFRSLRRCLLSDNTNTEGYTSMLLLVERKGYYKESIEFHNKLIDQDAYNWRAWLNLGFALKGIGHSNEAIEAFELAFAIEKSCKMAYMEAAELLLEEQKYMHALYICETGIFNIKEDADIMFKIGYCYEMLKEYKTANAYYQRVLDFNHDDADALYRMGECAQILGQYNQAITYYKEAIKFDNQREEFYASMADAYFQIDELSSALFSYRKAAYIAPEEVTYWLRYIYFLLNIGQERMALRALEMADVNCGAPELEYCRVACLYQMGKQSEALYRLSEALNCDYETHKSLFKWRPELAKNKDMQAVIMAFLP